MEDDLFPRPEGSDPESAHAESLFEDSKAPEAHPAAGGPATGPVDSYDVQDLPEAEDTERSPTPPVSAPSPVKRPEGKSVRSGMRMEPSAAVSQPWTRWGEWGGTVVALLVAAAGFFVAIYLLISWEVYGLAFFLFLAGGLTLALLSYPILITLERPVRVTPEQAVRDYFVALSHHRPQYRRMWLLLSDRGKATGSFASYEGFRQYWGERLAEIRGGKASGFTPLRFTVEDFKSPKSAGLETIEATYTVFVQVRGKHSDGAIYKTRVSSSLVKGPDRMWYIDDGTLS